MFVLGISRALGNPCSGSLHADDASLFYPSQAD